MTREVLTGLYEFDPYGTNPANHIRNEKQVVTSPGRDDFHFIIPLAAPFFLKDLKVFDDTTGTELLLGIDYAVGHRFGEAMFSTARAIYGSIQFLNRTYQGVVRLEYRTIGGQWGYSSQQILEELVRKTVNPIRRSWGQIAPLPAAFPPVDHDQNINDLIGFEEIVESIGKIAIALGETEEGAFNAHMINRDNPHNVTAVQIGLGNVANHRIANSTEATTGTANDLYMTPLRTKQAITSQVGTALTNHINNQDNPHQVTATQVGLGNVANYSVASTLQAQEGTANNVYMTPLRTRDFLIELGYEAWDAHVISTENPHRTDKTQIGLGNVDNFATASNEEAIAATANDLFMTPAGTRAFFNSLNVGDVGTHIGDRDNPHQVTAEQVGLGNVSDFATATAEQTIAGTASNLFTTPAGVKALIDSLNIGNVTDHIDSRENPHEVTAQQVGLGNVDNFATAGNEEMTALTSTEHFVTPAGVLTALTEKGILAHLEDEDNPHNLTPQKIGAVSQDELASVLDGYLTDGETASNANNVYGLSKEQLASDILSGKAADSDKFNGQDYEEFIEGLLAVRVGDSTRFDGLTREDWLREIPLVLGAVTTHRIEEAFVSVGQFKAVLTREDSEFTERNNKLSFVLSGKTVDNYVYQRVDVFGNTDTIEVIDLLGSGVTLPIHATVEDTTQTVWVENTGLIGDVDVFLISELDTASTVVTEQDISVSSLDDLSPVQAIVVSPIIDLFENAFEQAANELTL